MEILSPFQTPSLPSFFLLFLFVYLFAYFRVFHHWDPKHRAEASSCFISLTHGTPAVFMAIHALTNTRSPTFADPNSLSHNTVLEFSTAYFLVDLLHYLIFLPNDTLFILHHLATLYVFITCRFIVHRGSFALLALLILAEVTSLCQNIWTITGFRRADHPVAGKVFDTLSLPFYAFYTVVRGIIGPFFVYKMGVFYMKDENSIPVWAWVSWMIVIVIAILVSIAWVFDHWIDWFRRRNYQAMKKVA